MGVRFPSVLAFNGAATLVTTAETIMVTSPPFTPSQDGAVITILTRCIITTGAGTTGVQLRLRRGTSLTSPQVTQAAPTEPATAGVQGGWIEWYVDTGGVGGGSSGPFGGVQYTITAAQIGATANGTLVDALIFVFAL